MGKLSLLIILFSIHFAAFSQNIESVLRRNTTDSYAGKPLRIVEKLYFNYGTSQSPAEEFIHKKITQFDSLSRIVFIENYDRKEKLTDKLTNTYSATRNRIIKKVMEEWDVKVYTKKSILYAYDSAGLLTKIAENDSKDQRKRILKITSNKNGDPVDITVCDENGTPYATESAKYYYEKNAVITKTASNKGWLLVSDTLKIEPNKKSELIPEKDYIVNEKNEPISIDVKESDGYISRLKIKHKYDPTGNCILEKWQKFNLDRFRNVIYFEIRKEIEYRNN